MEGEMTKFYPLNIAFVGKHVRSRIEEDCGNIDLHDIAQRLECILTLGMVRRSANGFEQCIGFKGCILGKVIGVAA